MSIRHRSILSSRAPRWVSLVAIAASLACVLSVACGFGAAVAGAARGATPDSVTPSGQARSAASPASASYSVGYSRNIFTASGLSTKPATAQAYTFDARGSISSVTIAALASALDLAGSAELSEGQWFVGAADRSAPSLAVALDASLSFVYENPLGNPRQCGDSERLVDAQMPGSCPPPGDLPSESVAIDALRSLISSTGRDADTFEYTSDTWMGPSSRRAQAWPVIDGQRVDRAWSVELAGAGVFSASGDLATIVSLGDYSIISEQQAFDRLSNTRFGSQFGSGTHVLSYEAADESSAAGVSRSEVPAPLSAGAAIDWPVRSVSIVSSRMAFIMPVQSDGTIRIVPAYEFTDAEGWLWTVLALSDSDLDFSAQ